ncbi:MAG: phage tail sheath family protein [Clostridiaceae bacterium]|nr:phage tail sheath family protein [Clostridiaceae bacterium]
MFGGGSFTTQNKVLPGAYINFVSAASSKSALSQRGTVAVPLILSWGIEQEVFTVTAEEFQEHCFEIFGYEYEADEMLVLRELFRNMTKGVLYRLNKGVKASNDYAEAVYGGVRGNDITIVISKNVNDENKYDVKTMFAEKEADKQTVSAAADLMNNDYVVFKKDAVLAATAGTPLAGGTDGDSLTGADYSAFLSAVEPYAFNILCCPVADDAVKALFTAFTKRMRDEAGIKFQTVLYRSHEADYEGIISVENKAEGLEQGLVYWVAGAEAACAVNKTVENQKYTGEYKIDTNYTQLQLSDAVTSGKFMFHKAGDEVRVLMDINTLVTVTSEKNEDFSSNQTIRVLDQIGNDIAELFTSRYLGKISNDNSGRVSLWSDIVSYNKELSDIRAIEAVDSKEITVSIGNTKRSVVVSNPVTPVNCMSQLYMTIIVS